MPGERNTSRPIPTSATFKTVGYHPKLNPDPDLESKLNPDPDPDSENAKNHNPDPKQQPDYSVLTSGSGSVEHLCSAQRSRL